MSKITRSTYYFCWPNLFFIYLKVSVEVIVPKKTILIQLTYSNRHTNDSPNKVLQEYSQMSLTAIPPLHHF